MPEAKIPVLFGATASGKTSLSIALAKDINGQIINMDSLQIYRELSIGTAKPTPKEQDGVPHHLFDFLLPDEEYTVAQYQKDAVKKISEIQLSGDVPILVGGTGLYLSSLYYQFTFRDKSTDEEEFKELLKNIGEQGIVAQLREEGVKDLDSIDIKNPHRLFRVWHSRQVHASKNRVRSSLPLVIFHLQLPRDLLHLRIEMRTKSMLEMGLVREVQKILRAGYNTRHPALKGIGYKQTVQYLQGKMTLEELEHSIIVSTRQYAKRQLTWIRNQYPDVQALDGTLSTETLVGIIKKILKESP